MRRRWMRPRSSLTGSGYKIDLGPPIFAAFCASWSLAEHERVAFWRGVCQARWSLVSAWRQAILDFHPEAVEARAFVEEDCSPAALMAVLESLVGEGVLTRRAGNRD